MLARGWEVLCVDNLVTGAAVNVAHLQTNPLFHLTQHDVTRYIDIPGTVDAVLHFASPASPDDYLKLPIQTLKVGALGTHNALGSGAGERRRAFSWRPLPNATATRKSARSRKPTGDT